MSVTLVHPEERRPVAATRLIEKCALFKTNSALLSAPYAVKSRVPIRVFREFMSALEGGGTEITNANFAGFSLLCAEFGFDGLAARLSDFRSSEVFAGEVAEARARIAALEEPSCAGMRGGHLADCGHRWIRGIVKETRGGETVESLGTW
jgi:hypothetical protein